MHAAGQVRCTMPNGTVIEQKLAKSCPQGAVKGETFDGKPIALKPPAQQLTPPNTATSKQQPVANPKPVATDYDDARAICYLLLSSNSATSCDVDSSVFSTSVIDATVPGGILAANSICQEIKTAFRREKRPIIGKGWELRMFSPLGSGNRPMARCVL